MSKPTHVLAFISDNKGGIYIHADAEGLGTLIGNLQGIKDAVDRGECGHGHLMSDSWGGSELSESTGYEPGMPAHHVKIYGWTPEWAVRHGFSRKLTFNDPRDPTA